MTGALVELVTDGELRWVIRHAYSALSGPPAPAVAFVEASSTAPDALSGPSRPPTGPGSPSALPPASAAVARPQRQYALRLVDPAKADAKPRKRGTNGRGVRTASVEAKARRA